MTNQIFTLDMQDEESWQDVAEQFDCTVEEAQQVGLLLGFRGTIGNYEDELKQLDKGPYSNDFELWWDEKFREILSEIRAM